MRRGELRVDELRQDVLAHPRLALDEHRGPSLRRDLADDRVDLVHHRVAARDRAGQRGKEIRHGVSRARARQDRLDTALDHLQEPFEIHRLGHEVVRLQAHGPHGGVHFAIRGQDHDAEVRLVLPQARQHIHAIRVRKDEVEQHQVRSFGRRDGDGLGAGGGLRNLVTPIGERRGEKEADRLLVVDDEDLRRHAHQPIGADMKRRGHRGIMVAATRRGKRVGVSERLLP